MRNDILGSKKKRLILANATVVLSESYWKNNSWTDMLRSKNCHEVWKLLDNILIWKMLLYKHIKWQNVSSFKTYTFYLHLYSKLKMQLIKISVLTDSMLLYLYFILSVQKMLHLLIIQLTKKSVYNQCKSLLYCHHKRQIC